MILSSQLASIWYCKENKMLFREKLWYIVGSNADTCKKSVFCLLKVMCTLSSNFITLVNSLLINSDSSAASSALIF